MYNIFLLVFLYRILKKCFLEFFNLLPSKTKYLPVRIFYKVIRQFLIAKVFYSFKKFYTTDYILVPKRSRITDNQIWLSCSLLYVTSTAMNHPPSSHKCGSPVSLHIKHQTEQPDLCVCNRTFFVNQAICYI